MRRLLVLAATIAFAAAALVTLPSSAANSTVRNGHEAPPGACSSTSQPYTYEPASVQIAPGDSVTFVNPRLHDNGCPAAEHPTQCLKRSDGQCPWSTGDLPPGGQFTVEFPADGTFRYVCLAHPYMEGTITVGDGDPTEAEPSAEPTSEPASPPASPSSEPQPTASPPSSPSASPEPSPGSDAGQDDPAGDPTPDATAPEDSSTEDPDDATDQPSPTADDLAPSPAPSDAAAGDDRDAADASGGGGAKALATILLLVTAAALWRVRRGH